MNDPAGLPAAAWLGAHALVPYAAMLLLLLAATVLCWHLLQSTAQPRSQAPAAALSYGARWATGCSLAALGSATFVGIAALLHDGPAISALDLTFTDALARAAPAGMVPAAALLTRLGDPITLGVLGAVVGAALLLGRRVGLMLGWALAMGGNGVLLPTTQGSAQGMDLVRAVSAFRRYRRGRQVQRVLRRPVAPGYAAVRFQGLVDAALIRGAQNRSAPR